jgi:hypothetical protein
MVRLIPDEKDLMRPIQPTSAPLEKAFIEAARLQPVE